MNDVVQQMLRDELVDKGFYYGHVTVREAASIMQVAPQLIYYRIRTKKLYVMTCGECGREGLLDLREVIRSFPHTPKDVEEAEASHGEDVAAGGPEDGPGSPV